MSPIDAPPAWAISWEEKVGGTFTHQEITMLRGVDGLPHSALLTPPTGSGLVHIDALSVDGDREHPQLIVLFRNDQRPGVRFGFRWPLRADVDMTDHAIFIAMFMETTEQVHDRLPSGPTDEAIIWIDAGPAGSPTCQPES